MTTQIKNRRVDDVEKYYKPISRIGVCTSLSFWVIAGISFAIPYGKDLLSGGLYMVLVSVFAVLTIAYFTLSVISRFYLVPRAERMRRRQLLSNALGTHLIHESTSLYYNNEYSPSIARLGANIMENALFSKEVAGKMLATKRWVVGGYIAAMLLIFILRHENLDLIVWITQLVFSGEVLASWLKLECLRYRHERTYEQLNSHYLHGVSVTEPKAIANVLDAFVEYESAKSFAGIKLSTKIFKQLNPILTKEWERVRDNLGMNEDDDI